LPNKLPTPLGTDNFGRNPRHNIVFHGAACHHGIGPHHSAVGQMNGTDDLGPGGDVDPVAHGRHSPFPVLARQSEGNALGQVAAFAHHHVGMQDNLPKMPDVQTRANATIRGNGNTGGHFHPLPPEMIEEHDELVQPRGQTVVLEMPSGAVAGTGPEPLVEQ